MGRRTSSTSYITPILSDGTVQKQDVTGDTDTGDGTGRGWFLLAAGTYYFPIGGQDSNTQSIHLQHDAAVAISASLPETSDLPDTDTSWYSDTAGEWFGENPSTAYVPVDGATTTATNATVAVVAGNKGGARWNVADLGARRTRLKVVVTTQGKVRVATWGKE